MRGLFRKYKIKAKKLYTVIFLTILEMFMILWISNWVATPLILVPFVQFIAIFENRDVWKKLTEKEKKEITLSEEELNNFVYNIESKIKKGMSSEDILVEMKRN